MRQIKASEVKPGMKVRWESRGFTHEGTVERVTSGTSLYTTRFINGYFGINTPSDATVTVLSEPQPEEPTEFGARVIVDGGTALRTQDAEDEVDPDEGPWRVRSGCNTWDDMTWAEVCALGPVTVIPDQGWGVLGNAEPAPEVPDQIEEWPDNDEHLREHKWCDRDGYRWTWIVADAQWECRDDITDKETMTAGIPADGPWTRATEEPTPEVSERIEEWDTWEEVPEGVTVTNRKMCYYYRKAGSRVEALSPFNDVVMGGTGLYLSNRPGPWTRVTTNTISHEKKENA